MFNLLDTVYKGVRGKEMYMVELMEKNINKEKFFEFVTTSISNSISSSSDFDIKNIGEKMLNLSSMGFNEFIDNLLSQIEINRKKSDSSSWKGLRK